MSENIEHRAFWDCPGTKGGIASIEVRRMHLVIDSKLQKSIQEYVDNDEPRTMLNCRHIINHEIKFNSGLKIDKTHFEDASNYLKINTDEKT